MQESGADLILGKIFFNAKKISSVVKLVALRKLEQGEDVEVCEIGNGVA